MDSVCSVSNAIGSSSNYICRCNKIKVCHGNEKVISMSFSDAHKADFQMSGKYMNHTTSIVS